MNITEIYNTKEEKVNNEYLFKKGFYKISFKDELERGIQDFIIIKLKEDTWSSDLEKFMEQYHKDYVIKYLPYFIDYKEKEK
jgi:hypothetical protein